MYRVSSRYFLKVSTSSYF